MKTTRRHGVAACGLATGLLLIAGLLPAAPVWEGEVIVEDGIPVVRNSAKAPAAEEVLATTELWRLGGENEADPILGLISDVELDAQGQAYLLDTNLSSIHVMGPDGELRRTIGREGDGPGEFRFARALALLPDGNVGAMEMMPGKIVVLHPDGTPQASVEPEGFSGGMRHFEGLAADAYGLVLGGVATSLSNDGATIRHALCRYNTDGSLAVEILSAKDTQSGGAITLGGGDNEFTRFWTLCDDGRVVVYAKADAYRLEVFGRDGKPERVITRQYERLPRTDESMESERKQLEKMGARFGGALEREIEKYERSVSRVIPRPGGELWVDNSRGTRDCPAGAVGNFDVLDAEGRLVRTVRLPADFDSARDDYAVRGDRLFVFKEAQMTSSSMSSGGGGNMMMVVIGGGSDDEDEEGEGRPFEVICYAF